MVAASAPFHFPEHQYGHKNKEYRSFPFLGIIIILGNPGLILDYLRKKIRLHYLCLLFLVGAYQQLTGFGEQGDLQNGIVYW